MNHNFWYENPYQLINKKHIKNIIPERHMNRNEKLNSLVRLSFVISLVFMILTNNSNYLVVCCNNFKFLFYLVPK